MADNSSPIDNVIGPGSGDLSAETAAASPRRSSDNWRGLSAVGVPLALSVLAAIALPWAAGWTLGVFVGGLLLLTVLTPPAVLANDGGRARTTALAATFLPFAIVWMVMPWRTETHPSESLVCVLVLLSYGAAVGGLSVGLRGIRLSATVSAALAVVIALAWLTWPIWLSPTWNGEASAGWVDTLVSVHPGLAINLPHLGQWVEQSVAYHLTDLNQNVPYAPPQSVWPCVVCHAMAGAVGFGFAGVVRRRRGAPASDGCPRL